MRLAVRGGPLDTPYYDLANRMGVLTDLIVADRKDAQRVLTSDCPSRDFGGLDAKGIDTIKLGTLYAILTDTEFDPEQLPAPICDGGKNGPWVFEVPPDLVRRLAALDHDQLGAVAAAWAATEEFSPECDDWPAEAVAEVLHEIAALCCRAAIERKSVLMWNSL